jgi:hypothetical protein
MEVFKDIQGYEGYYQISNFGRVKTLARTYINGKGGLCKVKEAIKAPCLTPIGYVQITLYKDGVGLTHKMHRLVASHFIANPENKPEVNHKDGNKLNNHVTNLEWVTSKENIVHAEKTGLRNSKGQGNAFYGKKHSEQVKQLLSKLRGTLVLDTQTGVYYDSVKDAAVAGCVKTVTLHARMKRYKTEKRFITV